MQMIAVPTTRGPANIPDDAITRIIPPLPSFPFTQIWGPAGFEIDTTADPYWVLSQIKTVPPLAQFTAPDGTRSVWVKATAVSFPLPPPPLGAPLPYSGPNPNFIGCCLQMIGVQVQAVHETIEQATAILTSHGWHAPGAPVGMMLAERSGADIHAGLGHDAFSPWDA